MSTQPGTDITITVYSGGKGVGLRAEIHLGGIFRQGYGLEELRGLRKAATLAIGQLDATEVPETAKDELIRQLRAEVKELKEQVEWQKTYANR